MHLLVAGLRAEGLTLVQMPLVVGGPVTRTAEELVTICAMYMLTCHVRLLPIIAIMLARLPHDLTFLVEVEVPRLHVLRLWALNVSSTAIVSTNVPIMVTRRGTHKHLIGVPGHPLLLVVCPFRTPG